MRVIGHRVPDRAERLNVGKVRGARPVGTPATTLPTIRRWCCAVAGWRYETRRSRGRSGATAALRSVVLDGPDMATIAPCFMSSWNGSRPLNCSR